MSLPLLTIGPCDTSGSDKKRILPFEILKDDSKKTRVDLEGLDPPPDAPIVYEDKPAFRAAMGNLQNFDGEIQVERYVNKYNYSDTVVYHGDMNLDWGLEDFEEAFQVKYKRNFSRALDLFYNYSPNVMNVLSAEGKYAQPETEYRAELYTPQQWYDAFKGMGWNTEIELLVDEGIERATISKV
jgi:hypothetical protein